MKDHGINCSFHCLHSYFKPEGGQLHYKIERVIVSVLLDDTNCTVLCKISNATFDRSSSDCLNTSVLYLLISSCL